MPREKIRMRPFTFVVVFSLSLGLLGSGPARAQDAPATECAGECDETSPELTAAERSSAIATYERRAVILYTTGAVLLAGGIASMLVATAAWSGAFCDIGEQDCIDSARLINGVSAGVMFLGILAMIPAGLSTSAANRLREEEEESESARIGVRFGVGPNGGGVVLTGAF
jgi:hypothetical protein